MLCECIRRQGGCTWTCSAAGPMQQDAPSAPLLSAGPVLKRAYPAEACARVQNNTFGLFSCGPVFTPTRRKTSYSLSNKLFLEMRENGKRLYALENLNNVHLSNSA
jgi:hypothetical protein